MYFLVSVNLLCQRAGQKAAWISEHSCELQKEKTASQNLVEIKTEKMRLKQTPGIIMQ